MEQVTNLELMETVKGMPTLTGEQKIIGIPTNKENQKFVSSSPFVIFIDGNELYGKSGGGIFFKEYWFEKSVGDEHNFCFFFLKTTYDKIVLLVLKSKTDQRQRHGQSGGVLCKYNFEPFSTDNENYFDDIFVLRDDGYRDCFLRFHQDGRDYLHLVISSNKEKRFFRFDRIAWPHGNCKSYFDVHEVFTLDNIKVNEIFGFFPLGLGEKGYYHEISFDNFFTNYLILACSDQKYRVAIFHPFGGFKVSEKLLEKEGQILSFKNFFATNNKNVFCLTTEDEKKIFTGFHLTPDQLLEKIKNANDYSFSEFSIIQNREIYCKFYL